MSHRKTRRNASPARVMALQVTSQVRQRRAFTKQIVESMIDPSGVPEKERAFATLLSYGVVSCVGQLDAIIDGRLNPGSKITDDVRDCLRISVYEIIYLRKSAYAAVDQGVELVRLVAPQATGLANAVLRAVSEEADGFPWGDPDTDDAALARQYGFPEWIVKLSLKDRGRHRTNQMLEAAAPQSSAPIFVATNPFRARDSQVKQMLNACDYDARSWGAPGCFYTSASAAVVKCSALAESRALVSDAAAQLVAMLSIPQPGKPFLEIGAGRGTKTILLQGNCMRMYAQTADIYSVELHSFKTEVLSKRLEQFEVPDVTPVTGDARDLDSIEGLPQGFYGCLIDAPCSGLGTLRRHPEQRWRVQPDVISELAATGYEMLVSAAHHIERGGFIVYSTCTFAREENEAVIERFLASDLGREYELESFARQVPYEFSDDISEEGWFCSMPKAGGADGHFAAKLVRTGRLTVKALNMLYDGDARRDGDRVSSVLGGMGSYAAMGRFSRPKKRS